MKQSSTVFSNSLPDTELMHMISTADIGRHDIGYHELAEISRASAGNPLEAMSLCYAYGFMRGKEAQKNDARGGTIRRALLLEEGR